ncbi:DUF3306 domain-containing protein [Lacisediminimonas profundi]|uniref:DUF3306 domain-containing protein n=1 Tax=Lacisediminimonas profundi TaxID=2603856 RepID=UPI001F5018DC|nr:DUF3306 domain-containing protein [Lacisediminimonas profundi]
MAADDFFSRWSRKNEEARLARELDQAAAQPAAPAPDPYEGRLPTLEDVQQVSIDADFSPFLRKGVDESVQRSALKKLFTDPHFNIMDGLDIYIDDYSKSDPIPPEMMAMLRHAKDLFDPPGLRDERVMDMLEAAPAAEPEPAHEAGPALEAASEPASVDAGSETTAGAGPDQQQAAAPVPMDEPDPFEDSEEDPEQQRIAAGSQDVADDETVPAAPASVQLPQSPAPRVNENPENPPR